MQAVNTWSLRLPRGRCDRQGGHNGQGNREKPRLHDRAAIDTKEVEKIEAHIADALKKGTKIVNGSERATQGGNFFEPNGADRYGDRHGITKEEAFGPVAPPYRFKTDDENPHPSLPRLR